MKVLLSLGCVLIGSAFFYLHFFIARPVGVGPAGPSVDRQLFDKPWSERKIVVVGIGDSVTAGLGARSREHSYVNRLVKNPVEEFDDMQGCCLSRVLPNIELINLAVSGSTSRDHELVVQQDLNQFAPDEFGIVLMTSGGNDIIHNYGRTPPREFAMYGAALTEALPWISNYEARLKKMFAAITDKFPGGCEIYIADIYDPTEGVGDAPSIFLPHWPDGLAIHRKYNEAIQSAVAAHSNVRLVAMREPFLGHGAHCRQFWRSTYRPADSHYWYFINVEDPNDRGYDAIRRIFMNTILAESSLVPRVSKR
jgi:lysophospholipase L1-like esterase